MRQMNPLMKKLPKSDEISTVSTESMATLKILARRKRMTKMKMLLERYGFLHIIFHNSFQANV